MIGIVLATGGDERASRPKALAVVGDRSLVAQHADHLLAIGCSRVVVVVRRALLAVTHALVARDGVAVFADDDAALAGALRRIDDATLAVVPAEAMPGAPPTTVPASALASFDGTRPLRDVLGVTPPRAEDESGVLCRSCGMCCDGSLFGRGRLEQDEIEPARRLGLEILPDERFFAQPCKALGPTGCTVYDERPVTCHRFTCRLYVKAAPLEERLATVRRVRELAARLEASGVSSEGLETRKDELGDAYRELTRLLEDDFARAT